MNKITKLIYVSVLGRYQWLDADRLTLKQRMDALGWQGVALDQVKKKAAAQDKDNG